MPTFNCPHCRKTLKAPPEAAGKKTKCTGCGHRLVIPTGVAPQSVVPTAAPVPRPATTAHPVSVPCPHCSGQVGYVPQLAGQPVNCPRCGQAFLMGGGSVATSPHGTASADPFAFDGSHQEAEPTTYRKSRNQPPANLWMKIGGGIFVALAVLGFFALKELVKSGGSSSSRPTVAEFREKVMKLTRPGTHIFEDLEKGYAIDKDQLFEAVGQPDQKVDIGDGELVSWFWQCRDGQVQLIVVESGREIDFKFGTVVEGRSRR